MGVEAERSFEVGRMKPGWSAKFGCASAIASACVVRSASRSRIFAAPAAAPTRWMNVHICPLSGPRKHEAPIRPPTSFAATTAVRKARASAPSCSATASDAKTAEWQVWPIQMMSSKSWAMENAAFASAASAGARRPPLPRTLARPAPAKPARPGRIDAVSGERADACAAAIMSRTWKRAARRVDSGIAS